MRNGNIRSTLTSGDIFSFDWMNRIVNAILATKIPAFDMTVQKQDGRDAQPGL